MKRRFFYVLVFMTLLLNSCSTGESSLLVGSDYSGTKGVEFSFSAEQPPNELIPNRAFLVGFNIANHGAFDLRDGDKALLSLSYNNLYFDSPEDMSGSENLIDVFFSNSQSEGLVTSFTIPGVSPLNPDGGRDYILLGSLTPSLPSQRSVVDTELRASVCYPYVTKFSDTVCIDQSMFNSDSSREVCMSSVRNYRSQGAPVAVTKIDPIMTPIDIVSDEVETSVATYDEDGVFSGVEREVVDTSYFRIQPGFEVHIEKVGDGTIFYANKLPENACSENDDRQINVVRIFANLNIDGLECDQEYIRLTNGKGSTRCFLPESLTPASNSNYIENLNIDLDYYHVIDETKSVRISR